MANAFGMIDESIWRRDRDFRALPRGAQCTFLQLLSQRDVDCAGVLTLHVDLLAKGCDEITTEDIRDDLKSLEQSRFVFVDDDTDELLIRSYVRRVTAKSPNALKSALKVAKGLASPKLRFILASELRRLDKADATTVADLIEPSQNPFGTHSEPIGKVSEGGIPFESHSNPPSCSSVIAVEARSVVGKVGRGESANPPPQFCDRHPNGTNANCRDCGAARTRRETWDALQIVANRKRAEERREIANQCQDCDEGGWQLDDDGLTAEPAIKCDHSVTVR